MNQKNKKSWKTGIAFALVLCMLVSALGHILPAQTVKAQTGTATSYTVTLGADKNYFLCNATPATGPVTLTYTVESGAVKSGTVYGVVASAYPNDTYPYDGTHGAMIYRADGNGLFSAGTSYSFTMSVNASGVLSCTRSYVKADGTSGEPHLPHNDQNQSGNASSQYFGFYFANIETEAKLINVTCTDAAGNDLGLRVQDDKTNYTIEENEGIPSYTVTLGAGKDYFLCNQTPASGPVTLTYTVESGSVKSGTVYGAVASAYPNAQYPYNGDQGAMIYRADGNGLLAADASYSFTMSVDANGVLSCTRTVVKADDTSGEPYLPHNDQNQSGNAASQYFGLYFANIETEAKLINVTCTDAAGNDLGLRVQDGKTNYTIVSNQATDPEDPENPENPDNPDDEEQIGYTVTLGADKDYFLCNATPATGPVTLTYTVEAGAVKSGSIYGVVASAYPNDTYPYDGTHGAMIYRADGNGFLAADATYSFTMSVDANGVLNCSRTVVKADGTSGEPYLPHNDQNRSGNASSQYFGLYFANIETEAKLINVTCTDAEGNDLGLRVQDGKTNYTIVSNQATEPENPDNPDGPEDVEKSGYTVVLNGDANYYISNKKPTKGPVTMTYTVESSAAEGAIVNGVVATAFPDAIYPYDGDQGSMIYRQDKNGVLMAGYSYSITMSLDGEHKISYSATLNDGTTSGSPYLPHKVGNGNANSQYFGIYLSRVTAAKMVYVNFKDAEGNDLGVQVNQDSCVITSPEEELNYIRPEKDLPSEHTTAQTLDAGFRRATAGTFNVAEGTYANSKASGLYALSMHKLIFSAEIKFSEVGYSDIRYAGSGTGYGLAFATEGENLTMKDVSGNSGIYMFDPSVAGIDFTGNQFNLKLSTEYVDRDKDGSKDDVKLGVWFNDKLYANRYIYLSDYKLGKYLTVQSAGEDGYIEVHNTKGIAIGVDYTIFGYTSNWMEELGRKE